MTGPHACLSEHYKSWAATMSAWDIWGVDEIWRDVGGSTENYYPSSTSLLNVPTATLSDYGSEQSCNYHDFESIVDNVPSWC